MAEKPTASQTKKSDNAWGNTPYIVAAVLAVGALGWYFFVFVPQHLEYFVESRFRSLAVASGQVKSKVDNLQRALDGAVNGVDTSDKIRTYLQTLIPEMRLNMEGSTSSGLGFSSSKLKAMQATVPWKSIMAEAADASRGDFDDLALAAESGSVVWQRHATTPRIGNLKELLGAQAAPTGWFPVSLNWEVSSTLPNGKLTERIPDTPSLKSFNLNGTPTFLFVQAVKPSVWANPSGESHSFYVVGLVSQERLHQQAMHIPTAWVVLGTLPLVLVFLALPFIKLATLTSKERYRFGDAVLLVVATILTVALAVAILFVPSPVGKRGDHRLEEFANRVEEKLESETNSILDLSDVIQTESASISNKLEDCQVRIQADTPERSNLKRCGLWNAISKVKNEVEADAKAPQSKKAIWQKVTPGSLELDVAVWIDSDGAQTRKWSTKSQVTAYVPHRDFAHFRSLEQRELWTLEKRETKFTIEPMRSPTTSDMGFIFAVRDEAKAQDGPADKKKLGFILNVRPQSLIDPVIPPGYGFAVVAKDGAVLFHSEETRSLQENFFEEVGAPENMRMNALADRQITWTDDYHGRPHRLYMRPLKKFANSPWRVVTFQENEPVLGSIFALQKGIFRLWIIGILLWSALALGFSIRWWQRKGQVRDKLLALCGAFSRNLETLKRSVAGLTALAIVGIALWAATYDMAAGLDFVFLVFIAIPPLAIWIALWTRDSRMGCSEPVPSSLPASIQIALLSNAELALLIFLVAVIPTAGFARITTIHNSLEQSENWLLEARSNWETRETNLGQRLHSDAYPSGTVGLILAKGGFASIDVTEPPLFSYLGVLDGVVEKPPSNQQPGDYPFHNNGKVGALLEWTFPPQQNLPTKNFALDNGNLRVAGEPAFAIAASLGASPGMNLSGQHVVVAMAILGAILLGAFWASRKIATVPTVASPDIGSLVFSMKDNEGILLIGPPRMQKDRLVAAAVKPQLRIPLLDKEITDDFIQQQLNKVAGLILPPNPTGPIWIHVSNLESQLADKNSRSQVTKLLERLMEKRDGRPSRALIVTSSVDPIAQFKEIFEQERAGIYTDAAPELDLSRCALLFSRFRQCYLPLGKQPPIPESIQLWENWLSYNPWKWRSVAHAEVANFEPLESIVEDVKFVWAKQGEVPRNQLSDALQARARAYYELLWTSCTRSEKLVLIHLAQEGFVNPKSRNVVAQLMAKGLIVERPTLRVFNHTFRAFLRDIERHQVVHEWEGMEGSGLWVVAGRLIASSLLLGGVFFLLTQGFSVQTLLPILSGTGVFGVPILRDLMARLSGKGAAASGTA